MACVSQEVSSMAWEALAWGTSLDDDSTDFGPSQEPLGGQHSGLY